MGRGREGRDGAERGIVSAVLEGALVRLGRLGGRRWRGGRRKVDEVVGGSNDTSTKEAETS